MNTYYAKTKDGKLLKFFSMENGEIRCIDLGKLPKEVPCVFVYCKNKKGEIYLKALSNYSKVSFEGKDWIMTTGYNGKPEIYSNEEVVNTLGYYIKNNKTGDITIIKKDDVLQLPF